jgi:hypothetical protein
MRLSSEFVNSATRFLFCTLKFIGVRRGKYILRERKKDERQNAEKNLAERTNKMRKTRKKKNRLR